MLIFLGKQLSEMTDSHGLIPDTVRALYSAKREVRFAGILLRPYFWS